MISTSKCGCFESAQALAKPWHERLDELMRSFEDYHARLESALESSSEGLQGVPASLLPPWDSQST